MGVIFANLFKRKTVCFDVWSPQSKADEVRCLLKVPGGLIYLNIWRFMALQKANFPWEEETGDVINTYLLWGIPTTQKSKVQSKRRIHRWLLDKKVCSFIAIETKLKRQSCLVKHLGMHRLRVFIFMEHWNDWNSFVESVYLREP